MQKIHSIGGNGIGRLRLHVLASGSGGNCSVIEDGVSGACIVLDCGISKTAFLERCHECGVDAMRVRAILVSHEHGDHTKGLGVVTRGLNRIGAEPTVYASNLVHGASRELRAIENAVDLRHFAAGDALSFDGIEVHPFHTLHDAAESFGFRIDCAGDSIGFMTDTGIVTDEAAEALRGCRILALEANHDAKMLANGPYPAYLKARIASERGHLSNEQSAALVEQLLDDSTEYVIGMHVSQHNNTYRLPVEVLAKTIQGIGHSAIVKVGFQDRAISIA